MRIGEFLNLLDKPKKLKSGSFQAKCPAHNDDHASLSITETEDKLLIDCKAGCQTEDVCEALNISMADLFFDKDKPKAIAVKSRIINEYDYNDENGNLLYQVVRYEPKDFRQRRKNGNGEWVWDTKDTRKVLYRLDYITKATTETIYLVEGEKDAENLWEYGMFATTCPGGANAWKPEYANYLKDKKVVIIPDNDAAGLELAKQMARSLIGKASELHVILLDQKDISDWLAMDGDVFELPNMEQNISVLLDADRPVYKKEDDAILWHKPVQGQFISFKAENIRNEKTGIHSRITVLCDYIPLSWSLFNVERSEDRTRLANSCYGHLTGDITKAYSKDNMRQDMDNFCLGLWDYTLSLYSPDYEYGDENIEPLKFLLYPYVLDGGGTILFAPPGMGKSNTAMMWACSIAHGIKSYWQVTKSPILFINLERSAQSVRRRLTMINKVLGLTPTTPLLFMNARGRSLQDIMPNCRKAIKQHGVKCIFLDSISRAGYGDLTDNRPVNAIIDALSSLCDTWVALGHTPRADETHIFGGIHFDAGADIVVKLSSETKLDGTLGVGYEITKKNDLPKLPQVIWAMEFNENGLCDFRKARSGEFPEVEGKSKKSMTESITEFILDQDGADATTTEIADELGFDRGNISKILNKSGQFERTRKVGKNQYYGVVDRIHRLE